MGRHKGLGIGAERVKRYVGFFARASIYAGVERAPSAIPLHAMLPEMLFGEGVARALFEIYFKFFCLVFCFECKIGNTFPWVMLICMNGFARIIFIQSCFNSVGLDGVQHNQWPDRTVCRSQHFFHYPEPLFHLAK
jgi:hypothetical protein